MVDQVRDEAAAETAAVVTGTERTVSGKSGSEFNGSGPAERKQSLSAHRREVRCIVPQLILFGGRDDGCRTPSWLPNL